LSTLEHRYRNILRLYPAQHRQRFGEEMLGTLMEGADPRQRFPRPHELADLLWNAALLRFRRQRLPSLRDSGWADAASVGGLIAPAFLATYYALAQITIWTPILEFAQPFHAPWRALAAFGWWVLATILAAAGARLAAAAMAWLGALGLVAYGIWRFPSDLTVFTRHLPFILLALTAALCLTMPVAKRQAIGVLGRRTAITLAVAFVLVWVSPALQAPLMHGAGSDYGVNEWSGLYPAFLGDHPLGIIPLTTVLVLAAALIWLLGKQTGATRRRLLAIAAPAVVLSAVAQAGYERVVEAHSSYSPPVGTVPPDMDVTAVINIYSEFVTPPIPMTGGLWTAVLLLPVLTFLTALLLVRRGDQREELIALGRAELQRHQSQ
jgi:hypothetical protein